MYESPVDIITKQMNIQMDDQIMNAIQEVGIIVYKDELIKAINYDRDQYNKGFKDGTELFDRFAHELKEAFNAEIPINYESTKPFFTLENVRQIVDMVAIEMKNSGAE